MKILSKLRSSMSYCFLSYATYFWLFLFLLNLLIFRGTSYAIVGIFIYTILVFVVLPAIGMSFVILYSFERNIISNKTVKTNIIHDIGSTIFFIIVMIVFIAIKYEGITGLLSN